MSKTALLFAGQGAQVVQAAQQHAQSFVGSRLAGLCPSSSQTSEDNLQADALRPATHLSSLHVVVFSCSPPEGGSPQVEDTALRKLHHARASRQLELGGALC